MVLCLPFRVENSGHCEADANQLVLQVEDSGVGISGSSKPGFGVD